MNLLEDLSYRTTDFFFNFKGITELIWLSSLVLC